MSCCKQRQEWQAVNDKKRVWSLNETMDQLAMASSVCVGIGMLKRADSHVWRRPLEVEVKSQRRERERGIERHYECIKQR